MTDRAWKQGERRIASFFGTLRTSLSGGNSKLTRSDTMHPRLFIEAKQRKCHPILKEWDKCKKKAVKFGRVPVLALLVRDDGCDRRLLLFHCDDLKDVAEDFAVDSVRGFSFTTPESRLMIRKVERQNISVVNLWKETHELAGREKKTPLVTLQEKNRPGFWIIAEIEDLEGIVSEQRGRVNDQ